MKTKIILYLERDEEGFLKRIGIRQTSLFSKIGEYAKHIFLIVGIILIVKSFNSIGSGMFILGIILAIFGIVVSLSEINFPWGYTQVSVVKVEHLKEFIDLSVPQKIEVFEKSKCRSTKSENNDKIQDVQITTYDEIVTILKSFATQFRKQ